jgi:phosphoglycolate phosphatase
VFGKIKYILFDLDGTLIDSSVGVVSAVNQALESMGEEPQDPAIIKKFIGCPLRKMFESFSNNSFDVFLEKFQYFGKDIITDSAEPLPNVCQVLKRLHADGYLMGIGTTKFRIHLIGIIEKFKWEEYISVAVGGDEVPRVKPAPDIYIKALNLLGGDINNSLVVGDTVNDILAARAAGLPAVGVVSPFGDNGELVASRPDAVIQSIAELPPLLKKGGI